ncbi:Gfo/Idh/MocA family protein [Cellulomonas soli]|uniref:Oxidoreductase n=1 Tax=Cellulomonas soli TaxID=931535 RepID=A0A512PA19_9CELL|nr:Gfo/Idh/MocA family oxidoreductase [Cellulomonas soli]NYI60534.1 putative dehydrogenase [Cellulomonas soli]GEP68049.1 oxidoreductase [Cellulomonas soli]
MSVRLGVLGAAKILQTAVIDPARDVPDLTVTAIAARDLDRATALAAQHGIPRVLADYDTLLADPDVDAIYIPTPASLHGLWTARALAAGKHVLCEKPFTANADEAARIAALADGTGLVVMEAMHAQHHPAWARVRELLDQGVIGEPRTAEATFLVDIADRGDIRWQQALGGGALMDLGVYPLRFLQTVFGTPVVRAASAVEVDGVDGSITVRLDLPGGVDGTVRASMVQDQPEAEATIVGTTGTLRVHLPYHPQMGGHLVVETADGRTQEQLDPTPTYVFMLRAFAEAVLHGGPVVTDPAEAVRSMRVVDAADVAAGLSPRQPVEG